MPDPQAAAPIPRASRFAFLPVSLFGSVMGLSGLALAWRFAAAQFGAPAWAGELFGLCAVAAFLALALAYGIKCTTSPAAVRAEFAHPVAVNFFGTPIISLLLLPAVAAPYSTTAAQALWAVGATLMLAFAWLVVSRWISVRHQRAQVTPAWLIPVVGTINLPIAGATLDLPGAAAISTFGLAVGFFFAVPLFTLIFARLVFEEPLPPAQQPSLMILIAPTAIGFSAYLNVAGQVDLFASALFSIACFLFAVLLPRLIHLRGRMPFHASWWAVSFPLAAFANAALKFAAQAPAWPARVFAFAVLAFTTLVILSLALRTLAGIARGELDALTR